MRSVLKLCVLCVIFNAVAQAQQKPCLTASKFGPADQIGNVNYITPAKTLAASKLITTGKSYRLGVETNKDTPTRRAPSRSALSNQARLRAPRLVQPRRLTTTTSSPVGSESDRNSMALATSASTTSTTTATRPPISR
jgi:hypothetical protein